MKSDIFIHLGDTEREFLLMRELFPHLDLRFVRGNNDYRSTAPLHLIIDIPASERNVPCRIFATHGHRYNVNYGINTLLDVARANECNVVCFGHTHCRLVDYEDGMYIINPGSLSQPRDGKGCSYGYIDVTNAGIVGNVVGVN
jgi:putative phosphoesterase